eukprot:m.38047 g.38047  ORF g.38047 m.38047 type:complete len:169 (+) comp5611_c0_seq1:75-581(+)
MYVRMYTLSNLYRTEHLTKTQHTTRTHNTTHVQYHTLSSSSTTTTLHHSYPGTDEDAEASRIAAVQLRQRLGIHMVSIHQLASCSAATATDSHAVAGYFTAKPMLTTGGGDNFNAGLLSALLLGCKLETALRVAGATTGYYVRHGNSPSLDDIVGFLTHLPAVDALKS